MPVSVMAAVSSSLKLSLLELITYSAPISRSSCSCSGLRTMLISGIPSAWQTRFSICPRLEAEAVWMIPAKPSSRMVSTIPSTVIGLTKLEAASRGVIPCSIGSTILALTQQYCANASPGTKDTVLPTNACACSEAPAETTVPAHSLPTPSC